MCGRATADAGARAIVDGADVGIAGVEIAGGDVVGAGRWVAMLGRRMTSGVGALPTTGDGEGDAVYDSRSAPDGDGVERAVASTLRDTCDIEVCATLLAVTTGILALLTARVVVAPLDDDSDPLPAGVEVARLAPVAVSDAAGLRPCTATRWTTPLATALVGADNGNDGCALAVDVPAAACVCVVARGGTADADRAISRLAGACPLMLRDAPASTRRATVGVARAVTSGVLTVPLVLDADAGDAGCSCVSLDARRATLDANGNAPRAPFASLVAARRCNRSTRPADATGDA